MTSKADTLSGEVLTDFAGVLADELECIDLARHRQVHGTGKAEALVELQPGASPYRNAQNMRLAGLAFSGGGIRSATFNLGVIQALCTRECIGRFDYLSTVSGGGYIGSWLSALIKRRGAPFTAAAHQRELGTKRPVGQPEEDRAIGFLRAYSNYLTPKLGLLSTDTLAGVSSYLRNLILVQTTVIALLVFLLMLPRWMYAWFWTSLGQCDCMDLSAVSARHLAVAATVLWGISVLGIGANMHSKAPQWRRGPGFVWFGVMIPGVLGAIAWSLAVMAGAHPAKGVSLADTEINWAMWMAVFGAVGNAISVVGFRRDLASHAKPLLAMVFCGALGGLVGGAGFALLESAMRSFDAAFGIENLRWLALSVGPFAVLQIMSLGVVAYLGLLGRLLDHQTHEWWARYGAYILALSVGIGGAFAISVYGPVLVSFGQQWVVYAGGPVWLLTSAWGLYKGASADSKGDDASWTERALSVAPYVFILGLTVLLASVTHHMTVSLNHYEVNAPDYAAHCPGTRSDSARGDSGAGAAAPSKSAPCLSAVIDQVGREMSSPDRNPLLLLLISGSAALWLTLAWRVDINLFSFHNFYRNRLTRCYLGGARMGSTSARNPHPFTGFDKLDDLNLGELAGDDGRTVCRPFHLLNTTLNMSAGKELAWQQRKAGSFVFSPLYCGYELPATAEHHHSAGGFARTASYMWPEEVRGAKTAQEAQRRSRASGKATGDDDDRPEGGAMLGSVMAISGAAASPNWGFHTSSAVAFILTMFNIRLGRWCPNPTPDGRPMPRRASPIMGGWLLLKELFGATSASSKYVYLSDGGHFDNLGIYELVRRRVSTIVVCDCGQDEKAIFDDLADTLRKCYTDFGVVIRIDIEDLKGVATDGGLKFSKAHCVTGEIRYPAMADGTPAFEGKLMLVKPGLSAKICAEAPDIRNYAFANPGFPQQTTGDQWFDEAQFESYRKLGYLIGMSVFVKFDGELPKRSDTFWH